MNGSLKHIHRIFNKGIVIFNVEILVKYNELVHEKVY